MIHQAINTGSDEWGRDGPARAEDLARLPALLRALPPSDPAAARSNRVVVAFPVDDRWVVRTYRKDAMPEAFEALSTALSMPN
jgi:hypothetical protein